uniref:Uncharacterized protein n=1 Tax=Caenorhabditis japonica TaxID=281687 RepID=A0A8R1EN83_CAEJA
MTDHTISLEPFATGLVSGTVRGVGPLDRSRYTLEYRAATVEKFDWSETESVVFMLEWTTDGKINKAMGALVEKLAVEVWVMEPSGEVLDAGNTVTPNYGLNAQKGWCCRAGPTHTLLRKRARNHATRHRYPVTLDLAIRADGRS